MPPPPFGTFPKNHPFWYPDPSLIVVIACWLRRCVFLTLCLPGCAGTVWPFQGCLCFQESTALTRFSKCSKWASLDNVRNISAILRACDRRWRWSVLPSLYRVLSVECGVWSVECPTSACSPLDHRPEAQVFKDQIFRRDSDIWLIPFQVCRKCMMARSSSAMSATTAHFS